LRALSSAPTFSTSAVFTAPGRHMDKVQLKQWNAMEPVGSGISRNLFTSKLLWLIVDSCHFMVHMASNAKVTFRESQACWSCRGSSFRLPTIDFWICPPSLGNDQSHQLTLHSKSNFSGKSLISFRNNRTEQSHDHESQICLKTY
jgi:hypothetical protein